MSVHFDPSIHSIYSPVLPFQAKIAGINFAILCHILQQTDFYEKKAKEVEEYTKNCNVSCSKQTEMIGITFGNVCSFVCLYVRYSVVRWRR